MRGGDYLMFITSHNKTINMEKIKVPQGTNWNDYIYFNSINESVSLSEKAVKLLKNVDCTVHVHNSTIEYKTFEKMVYAVNNKDVNFGYHHLFIHISKFYDVFEF